MRSIKPSSDLDNKYSITSDDHDEISEMIVGKNQLYKFLDKGIGDMDKGI